MRVQAAPSQQDKNSGREPTGTVLWEFRETPQFRRSLKHTCKSITSTLEISMKKKVMEIHQ